MSIKNMVVTIAASLLCSDLLAVNMVMDDSPPSGIIWEKEFPSLAAIVSVTEGILVVRGLDGCLRGLGKANGDIAWSRCGIIRDQRVLSVYQNTIVFGDTASGAITAIDARNGKDEWMKSLPAWHDGRTSAYRDKYISADVTIHMIDRKKGCDIWKTEVRSEVESFDADGDVLLWLRNSKMILSLESTNGSLRWKYSIGEDEEIGWPPVVCGGGIILALASEELISIDIKEGRVIWRSRVSEKLHGGKLGLPSLQPWKDRVFAIYPAVGIAEVECRSGGVTWMPGGMEDEPSPIGLASAIADRWLLVLTRYSKINIIDIEAKKILCSYPSNGLLQGGIYADGSVFFFSSYDYNDKSTRVMAVDIEQCGKMKGENGGRYYQKPDAGLSVH